MFNSSFDFGGHEAPANDDVAAPALSNEALASGLEHIAALIQTNAKRVALRRAAAIIRSHSRPVATVVALDGPAGVNALGIDWQLCGVVTDWVRTGRLPWLEALEARRHHELISLPGIGPKLARELREVLGVVDLAGLARAAREGQLTRVCGIGPKRLKVIEALLGVRAA